MCGCRREEPTAFRVWAMKGMERKGRVKQTGESNASFTHHSATRI